MGMSRAQLSAALWGLLQRQFTEVGIENEDSTGNLKEPVDFTLLALGTSYDDLTTGTVASADVGKAMIVARFYGLQAAYDAALGRVDMSVGAPSVSKSGNQYVKDLAAALAIAETRAKPYLPDTGAFGFATLILDHIEPYDVEGA